MILDQILQERKKLVEQLKQSTTIEDLKQIIRLGAFAHLDFKEAIRSKEKPLNIIAEVKKASPSKGLICKEFDPVEIAKSYEKGGAAALSVLTEPKYFLGRTEYVTAIKKVCRLPILRKDFIVDAIQIYEAKAIGADAILLIVAALTDERLKTFIQLTKELELDALVETHNEREIERALAAGAEIIGVNNRDLQTFNVSLETCERLRKWIPKEKVFVAESGIHTVEDIRRLKRLEVDAVLIGESVVKAENREEKLKELIEA